jgi:Domain of unknown function (DUF5615)
MMIWIDAQLPPTLAEWIAETFGLTAISLRELGLRDVKDIEIFECQWCSKALFGLGLPSDLLRFDLWIPRASLE